MFDPLCELSDRLDRTKLRVRRPHHIVFLCGGLISPNITEKAVLSVRDYLYRIRQAQKGIGASFVLAEAAQELYRDTTYHDLISFEEDIAKVASVVLVISESPGSLAELGSFSSEPAIRDTVRIIISEAHASSESFVRYGPVRRIESFDRTNIGVFPWNTHRSSGYVVKASIRPHFREICNFIESHVSAVPDSFSYALIPEKAPFFDLLWILSVLDAVPPEPLYQAFRHCHPTYSDSQIKNLLYVLRVCGWVNVFSYSGRDYYYLSVNRDPFEYAFRPGLRVRDVAAAKLSVAARFHKDAAIGKAVTKRLLDKRSGR